MKVILYVHGMGGSSHEAEHYRKLCEGFDIIGVEYDGSFPSNAMDDIRSAYDEVHGKYEAVYVIANSIGAYFTMLALQGHEVEKALLISPILNMESLILNMMERAGISEDELRRKGEIDSLSWKYLSFVRENPVAWSVPTEIVYAGNDNITPRSIVDEFVRKHNAGLTVMENGEHWFHTEEQVAFLDEWIRRSI